MRGGEGRLAACLRVWLLLCFVLATPVMAGQALPMAVLTDVYGSETIDSVRHPDRADDFRPVTRDGFSGGFTRKVFWFRVELDPAAFPAGADGLRRTVLEVQPPFLHDLRLFVPTPSGRLEEHRAGTRHGFDQQGLGYRSAAFRLVFDDTRPQTVYLRLQTHSSAVLVLRHWDFEGFYRDKQGEYLLLGAYYGFLASAILFAVLLGAWRREPMLRSYVAHLGVVLLFMLGHNGVLQQFLFVEPNLITQNWAQFLTLLLGVSAALFYRQALELDATHPRLARFYRVVQLLCGVLLPTPALELYSEAASLVTWLLLLMAVSGMYASVQRWRSGKPGGVLLSIAHMAALGGGSAVILTLQGILPGSYGLIHGYQIGTVFTVGALSLMVLQRVRSLEHERQLMQARAEESERRQREANLARERQQRMLASLSHEVRTPLAMIDGAAQSLEHLVERENAEIARRLDRIRRGAGRLKGLISRFIDLDRFDHPDLAAAPTHFDLEPFCRRVVAQIRSQRRVELEVDPGLQVRADAVLLETALVNLLDNADKYSPLESPIRLEVTCPGTGSVVFRVRDFGDGVPEDEVPGLFECYVRGRAFSGDVAGVGLGLYLVRRIAELHGGSVRYERGQARGGEACGGVFVLEMENQ